MAPKFNNVRNMMAAVSNVLSRANLGSLAGMTFGNKRDMYKALGYLDHITVAQYRARYERGGLAGRIMEAMPKATWGRGPEIVEDEDPEVSTQFEQEIQELDERLNLWSVFRRADILAGIGRFGVVLIGAPGEFSEPIERLRAEDIHYLTPWSEQDVGIDTFVEDVQDPRFGLPLQYNFTRMSANIRQEPKKVHWSRVLHIADGVLDEMVLGMPRLQKVWNLFDDLEKVTGGGSEAFWLRVHPGFQLDVDKDTVMEQKDMDMLAKEVEKFEHDMTRFVKTRGTSMNALNTSVTGFANNADALLTQIAGTTEIPKRILVGSEAAHLASSQDRTNWHDRIDDRRVQYAEPQIIRAFIDHLQSLGALRMVDEYTVRWPIIQNLDESEQANVADKLAGLNSKAGETVITGAEIRDRVLQLPPLPEVEGEDAIEQEPTEMDDEDLVPEPPPEGEDVLEEDEELDNPVAATRRDVDKAPKAQPWDDVHKAADKNRIAFAKAFANAVKSAKRETTLREIRIKIEQGDTKGLDNIALLVSNKFQEEAVKNFPELILATMDSGGKAATSTAKAEGELTTLQVVLAFDVNNPLAVEWAAQRSAAMVTAVTDTTRAAIQEAMALALEGELTPAVLARTIKGSIGLTPRQADSIQKNIAAGLSDKQAAALATRYLKQRATNIARTETIAAANEGQRQLWLQSKAQGLITENEIREWITTPDDRLCEICEPMDGQTTSLEGLFETGDGGQVQGPPAHSQCRCAVGLTTAKKESVA